MNKKHNNPQHNLFHQLSHRLVLFHYGCLLLILAISPSIAQTNNPGNTNPIVPVSRRMLFPDQHVLTAMPLNPDTQQAPVTYTDWARSKNLESMQLQGAFDNGLEDVQQARAAAGHILSQKLEQVAVAHFTGASNDPSNTLTINIQNTDGTLSNNATTMIPAWSTAAYASAINNGNVEHPVIANSFGIATGELSPREDVQGAAHSEVVLCTIQQQPGSSLGAMITVLDYTDINATGIIKTQRSSSQLVSVGTLEPIFLTILSSDTSIACETGDINGDGVDEIIVTYLYDSGLKQWVGVFQYINDGTNPPFIEQVGTPVSINPMYKPGSYPFSAKSNGSVDIATGDFNGNHQVDIAVSSVMYQIKIHLGEQVNFPMVSVISSDKAFNLTVESQFAAEEIGRLQGSFQRATGSFACNSGSNNTACDYMRATLVSGLFKYDPTPGFDFNRHQLALVFNMPFLSGGGLRAFPLSISDDLSTISQMGETLRLPQQACPSEFCPSGQRFSVASGGLVGSTNINDPLWSLAISNWETTLPGNGSGQAQGQFHSFWLKAPSDASGDSGFEVAWEQPLLGAANINGPVNARLPSVAWDREGNSVWLGAPVHMTVYDLIKADYIIQEPPKHTYWWPPTATRLGQGQVIDLSRVQGFFIELSDSESRDYSFTHTDQTDWTIGGSVAVTASGSVTVGVDAGLFGSAKTTGSQSVQGKVGYDYNENVDSYESNYREQTTTFTGATNADDLLIAEVMRLDVWRYPVSGIELEDGLNAFWEITFPGRSLTVQGGGLNFDWYQPPHENGNVLSYPQLVGSSYIPPDCCAEFTFVEDSKEVAKSIPFLDDRLLFWDGTGATIDLQFSEQSGSGSAKSYTHKLTESVDIQVGYKSEVSFAGTKAEAEVQVDVNLHNSNSWAEIDTEKASTSNSTGFLVTKPPGNANQSYTFLPVFYLAESGTTKVTHAADVLGTGATFWPQTYGQLPDPALNLPRRFSATTPDGPDQFVWVVNESDDARRIRGFFVRYDELSADGYPLVGGAVTDGEMIRLEAEVFNYSTAQSFMGMDVAFVAVKYNPASNTEIGDRIPLTCGAESNTRLFLNPLKMTTARCTWDTTSFGPSVPGAIQDYRIYVTLDPDNTIEELYEGTVGPGQNNQGWGVLGIAHPQDTFRTPTPTEAVPNGADVQMTEEGLALQVNGELVTESAVVVREQLTPLRVCVDTDQSQTGYHHILIWDGNPEESGQLIADKMITNVDVDGGNCTWLPDFRFSEAGEHVLYAQLLETGSDGLPGNAWDTLEVMVQEIPVVNPYYYQGLANNVGAAGEFNISGRFSYSGDLDLTTSHLVIASVLDEIGGGGELIPGVGQETGQNLVLYPRMTVSNRAFFSTPYGQKPRVSVELSTVNDRLTFSLKVKKADIGEPELCNGSTILTTELIVLDNEKAPLNLTVSEPWTCKRSSNGDIKRLVLKSNPVVPGPPDLSILINGLDVALNWDRVIGARGYKLYYAPYPYTGPESIVSLDLGNKNSFSAELWEGAAFFVAISAYNSVGESGYSNIEQFNLK